MNVSLTDKLEEFVNRLIDEGRYRSASEVSASEVSASEVSASEVSASEVVREGLRLLEIREAQLTPKPKETKKSKEK